MQQIGGAPRLHLDLVGSLAGDVPRLAELGAGYGPTGAGWRVMTSPAGLPFCVREEAWPHERPSAAGWPDGQRTRLVQLCVDVPADRYDAERGFWRAATGWADEPVISPVALRDPVGLPFCVTASHPDTG